MGAGISLCRSQNAVEVAPTMTARATSAETTSQQTSSGKSQKKENGVLFVSDESETGKGVSNFSEARSCGGTSNKSRNMSLRRAQSLYASDADGDGEVEVDGDIKETTMLRLGSVRNTGVFVNQYAIVKNLGAGSFGKVKLGMNTVTGELVALKIVTRASKQRKQMMMRRLQSNMILGEDPDAQFAREIAVMKKLRHVNVVQLIEVIDDPNSSKLILVMEYVDGGVVDCSSPLKESLARKYFQDAARGLHYLHRNNIIHGDIKPDNMLLSDEEGVLKLTDFGSSAHFERGDTLTKTNGTPAFMCPEMCEAKPYRGRVADCWALGICLWTMLFGKPPFQGSTIIALYESIRDNDLEFPEDIDVSEEVKDLLMRTLKKDPDERLDLDGMMTHVWTTENGEVDLLADEGADAYELADNARIQAYQEITELLSDFPKRTFSDGEYLFIAGFEATEMYFIADGKVDVVLRETDRVGLIDRNGAPDLHSDGEGNSDSEEDEDEDEEDDIPNEQEDGLVTPGENKMKPAWAVSKFSQSTYNVVKHTSGHLHKHMSMQGREAGEEHLGVKSAGEFVGSVGLPDVRDDEKKHITSARAKGVVTAYVIERDAADAILEQDPERSVILRKAMSKREVENQVYNVMARLSTLHKNIQDDERRKTGNFKMEDLPPELR